MADLSKKQIEDIHFAAMTRFGEAHKFDNPERRKCIDDIRFAQFEDGQWDDCATKARADRPRYTINKTAPAVNQVIGEHRQSRVTTKVRPARGGTKEIAQTFNGLIRNIAAISKAQNSYDTAFKSVVNAGFGAWRIATEFSTDDTFDQDIKIRPIASAVTDVWVDPTSQDPNGRDANWMFVITEMSKTLFRQKFPKAVAADFDGTESTNNGCQNGWVKADVVRVAEYWTREMVSVELVQLSDNRIITSDKFHKIGDELLLEGITEVKRRKVKRPKITMALVSGAEVLQDPKEWAGKFIPIILVYGYSGWVDGKHYYRGIVRNAKDAQRVYNYTISSIVETSALTPKDPYWVTSTQIEGFEQDFKNFNVKNLPFMRYKPDPKAPGPPQRTGAPAFQQGMVVQAQQAEADIQATTGLFAPSLGDSPDQQSGRAILAQQRQGDKGSFELFDNLAKGIEYEAEILVDLIPKVYDGARQERILNEDGTTEFVEINQTIRDEQTGKDVIVNDLSQGKYDVLMDVGPSYKSQRTESVNVLNTLMSGIPELAPLVLDLMAKDLDFPFSEELTKRIRRTQLGQPAIEPNEEELEELQQGQAAQQEAQAVQEQLQQQVAQQNLIKLQLDNEKLAGEVDALEIENIAAKVDIQKKRSEINKDLSGVMLDKAKAGIAIEPDEVEAKQENIDQLNNSLEMSLIEQSEEAAQIFPTNGTVSGLQ